MIDVDLTEFIEERSRRRSEIKFDKIYYAARREHAWLLSAEDLPTAEIARRLGIKGSVRGLIITFSQEVQRATIRAKWSIR